MATITACGTSSLAGPLGKYRLQESDRVDPAFVGPSAQLRCGDLAEGAPFGVCEIQLCLDCAKKYGFVW